MHHKNHGDKDSKSSDEKRNIKFKARVNFVRREFKGKFEKRFY